MADSYFLTSDKDGNNFKYSSYGCCEYAGDGLKKAGQIAYEFIDTTRISNPYLRNKNIIEEYVYLAAEFLGIQLSRVELPNKDGIYNLPSYIRELNNDEFQERFICFQIGPYLSNKHFVALHTVIRYLWFDGYYLDIVNIVLNIRRYVPNFPIEDTFAIAHSFQERTSRALTGKSNLNKFGFMYFRPQKEFLPELKKNISFNSVFDDYEISLIPKITIKGSFFDDSEVTLESKSFISFLTSDGNDTDGISEKILKDALDIYLKYKDIFLVVRKKFNEKKNSYRIMGFEINSNNNTLESMSLRAVDNVNSSTINQIFNSEVELYNFMDKLK